MTDAQTTFARATLEYDEEHERAPLDPITQVTPTVSRATQLRRTSRKADCINRALAAMRAGRSLHLQHRNGNARWSLSNGQPVTADVAAILTCHALVVPADAALFSGLPEQLWRYVND